jgi:hypothetical protein
VDALQVSLPPITVNSTWPSESPDAC